MNEAAVNVALKFVDQATAPMQRALGNIERSTGKLEAAFGIAKRGAMALLAAFSVQQFAQVAMAYEDRAFQMSETFKAKTGEMVAAAKNMTEQFKHYYDLTEVEYAFVKTADSMERYGIVGEQYLNLVARAADVGASKNLELKESIDRIESAMRGEAEASEYLGLTLNDTYMKTMAFNGALREKWEKLDDTTKAYYRYYEMMRQSEKYEGAAERATNTLSGALKSLWGNIKDRLSPALIEVNSHLVGFINLVNQAIQKPSAMERAARLQESIISLRAKQASSAQSSWSDINRMITFGGNPPPDSGIQAQINAAEMELRDLRRSMMSQSMRTVTLAQYEAALPPPPPGGDKYIEDTKKTGGAAKEAAKALEKERQAILELEATKAQALAKTQESVYGKLQEGAMDAGIRTGGVFNAQAEARFERHNDILQEGLDLYREMRTPLEQYNAEMEKLVYLLQYGAINQDTFNRASEGLKQTLASSDPVLRKINDQIDAAGSSLSTAIIDTMNNSQGSIEQFFNSILQGLQRMIVELMIVGPLMQQLKSSMAGGFSGGGGGGFWGTVGNFFSGLFGGGGKTFTSAGGASWSAGQNFLEHAKGDYWFTEPTAAVGLRTGKRHLIAEAGQAEYLAGPNPRGGERSPNVSVNVTINEGSSGAKAKVSEGRMEYDHVLKRYVKSILIDLHNNDLDFRGQMGQR